MLLRTKAIKYIMHNPSSWHKPFVRRETFSSVLGLGWLTEDVLKVLLKILVVTGEFIKILHILEKFQFCQNVETVQVES